MEVTGVPEYVIVSGRVCVDECELKAVHGFGKYITAEPFGTYVYDMINDKEKVLHIDPLFPLLVIHLSILLFYFDVLFSNNIKANIYFVLTLS